ncbi:MAG: SusC/RagA family TonB-linked outer membrane protein [Paludibacter sp.]
MHLFRRNVKWGLLLMVFSISFSIFAQKKAVYGVVTDPLKDPIIGATVIIKGAKEGTVTDINGRFTIQAASNATLVISFIGYENQEIKVTNQPVLNVTLQDKSIQLNETVVIGYGSVKRKDLTGSVAKVNIAEMNAAPVATIDQALAGRIAGVSIIAADAAPGAQAQVTIRGGSLSQDATPLFVIDGFPMENFDMASLDPKNVESIDILKDASSIAIYGSRGANGVVIVNMKQGVVGKPKVNYSYNFTLQTEPNMPKMMDAYEYVKLQQEIASKTGSSYFTTFKKMYLDDGTVNGSKRTPDSYKNDKSYNWPDILMSNAPMQNHSLSINGGTTDTKYNLSFGYVDQKGVILNTGMKRYNAQMSLDQQISKSLRAQFKATHSTNITQSNTVMNNMRQYRPTSGLGGQDLLIAELDSSMLAGGDLEYGIDPSILINPLQQAQNEQDVRKQASTQVNAKIIWRFLKDFQFTSSLGGTFINNNKEQFYNSKTVQGNLFKRKTTSDPNSVGTLINANGINGVVENQDVATYLNENLLNYRKKFNKNHTLDVLLGFTYQYSGYQTESTKAIKMAPEFESTGLNNLSSGLFTNATNQMGYWGSANQLFSYLGRVNYTLKDRYLFTVNFRSDGSSKFYKGNQWGFFPSGAFAWRLIQEPFMNALTDVVSDAKIRLSAGSVGNNRGVSDFSYLLEFGQLQNFRAYSFDGTSLTNGLTQYFYSNPTLTWEKTKEFNIGTDWSFFKEKFTLTADYYRRITSGFLMAKNIPYYAGYFNGGNTRYENVGSVMNQGLELTLGATLIQNKNLTWKANFNMSYNTNKVMELAQGNDVLLQGADNITTVWIAKKDGNISQFYGFMSDGLYQVDDFYNNPNGSYTLRPDVVRFATLKNANYPPQPGDRKYKDLNGDKIIDDNDRTTLGSPIPFLIGGFSTNATWKGFNVQAFFQYSYGNKVLNYNALKFGESGQYWNRGNMYATFADRWTPENTNTDIPRVLESIGGGDVSVATPRITDKFVEDGSFIRFKTLSVSYTVPKKVTAKLKISNLMFVASAQNIALWTKYSGQDPEVSNYAGVNVKRGTGYTDLTNTSSYSSMTGGMDNAAYPRSLMLNGGINITF